MIKQSTKKLPYCNLETCGELPFWCFFFCFFFHRQQPIGSKGLQSVDDAWQQFHPLSHHCHLFYIFRPELYAGGGITGYLQGLLVA